MRTLRKKKRFLLILSVLFIMTLSFFSGASLFKKSLTLTLTDNGITVFEKNYTCSPDISISLLFLYKNSFRNLYESKYLGNEKLFFGDLNTEIYSDVSAILAAFETTPVEPSVTYHGSGNFTFCEGTAGKKCNVNAVFENLAKYGKSDVLIEAIPFRTDIDELKSATVKASSAVTLYENSSQGRKSNIALAAERLNGTVIFPGKEFSFNKTVGRRTKENGYCEARVIQNGEYTEGVGGGVCQVSTTLYNAWLKSGQNALRSASHSLKPSYVTPGLDAMVSDSSDLVLFNSGDYPAYIAAYADGIRLTVIVYTKPLPCKITLGSEPVRSANNSDVSQKETYRSYREYSDCGEVYHREYLRISSYGTDK